MAERERRRAGANRAPAGDSQLEQYQVWTRTQGHLQKFMATRSEDNTVEKVAKVNRYIGKFPASEDMIKTTDMLDQYKPLKAKLAEGLESTRTTAEKEIKTLDEALEHVSILLALRRPAEGGPSGDTGKRKRIRLSSPAQNAHSPSPAPASSASGSSLPRLTVRLPTRAGERERSGGPLKEGRRVAFRPPKSEEWILGLVKKHLVDNGKHVYEVQDADTDEPGPVYSTNINSLIPLPDPNAPVGSPAHISSYPEFAPGAEVMAIYVSTTSFYRAVVVAGPKDPWPGGRTVKKEPQYKLTFDDDGGKVQSVNAFDVVEWPGSGKGGTGSTN